jgi:hypothetical protein
MEDGAAIQTASHGAVQIAALPVSLADIRTNLVNFAAQLNAAAAQHEEQAQRARAGAATYLEAAEKICPAH